MPRRKHVSEIANSDPETILPTQDFRADAFGDGNQIVFRAGIASSPVPAAFAQAMREKGRAAPKSSD